MCQIVEAIPMLRGKRKRRKLEVPDETIVFLLARTSKRAKIRRPFPKSQLVLWLAFRRGNGGTGAFTTSGPNP
jgi:hypothetical protein